MPPGHVVIKTDALSRTFSSVRGTTVAVDTLDLEVYDRHVTALLGHNGAGKSTTIGMLTGATVSTHPPILAPSAINHVCRADPCPGTAGFFESDSIGVERECCFSNPA